MIYLAVVTLISCFSEVSGDVTCGDKYGEVKCFGFGAQCCGMRNEECCWDANVTAVTNTWWFWFIAVIILTVACTCIFYLCICRRPRLASSGGYVIITQNEQSQYGNHGYNTTNGVKPTAPPAYREKPPDYSTN